MQPRNSLSKSVWFALGMLGAGVQGVPLAQGAFDLPATWQLVEGARSGSFSFTRSTAGPNLGTEPLNASGLEELSKDSDHRVSREFLVPASLRPQFEFWLKIYTLYSSQEVVIFDEEHPSVVYDVLDFRELAKKSRNRAAYEIVSRSRLKARLEEIRSALKAVGNPVRKKSISKDARRFAALRARIGHKHSSGEIVSSLRIQWGQRDQVMSGLTSSKAFIRRMESIFAEIGVPPELVLLSLVESSFNWKAVSKSGAAGVWQFMPKTGKEFMTVSESEQIDERLSPIKSTVAAARLLTRNFRLLGSWALAISAYNHGHTKWRQLSPSEVSTAPDLLSQCSRTNAKVKLGFASRNYYSEFLALLRAYKYQDVIYGQVPEEALVPVRFVRIQRSETLSGFAARSGLLEAELRRLNPDLRAEHPVLPRGYWISVPGNEDDFAGVIERRKTLAKRDSPKSRETRMAEDLRSTIPRG